MKKTQEQQVIEIIEKNNGYATLGLLNKEVDVSDWKTKTPYATIRRIVQKEELFFKIKPGLWALNSYKNKLPEDIKKLTSSSKNKEETERYSHSYYQGLLLEIGNWKNHQTFVPNQDKNNKYLDKKLSDLRTLDKIHEFSYSNFLREAKTIDVSWFNNRNMPHAFFEIEHSTPMDRSLIKFRELMDFNCYFFIVAPSVRKKEYDVKIKKDTFRKIRNRTKFYDYESLSEWHSASSKVFYTSPFN